MQIIINLGYETCIFGFTVTWVWNDNMPSSFVQLQQLLDLVLM